MRSFARLFSSSRRAPPKAASKPPCVERLPQRLGLHHLGVELRAGGDRRNAALQPVLVDVDDQIEAEPSRRLVAKGDHLAELPGRVDMQQRERGLGRIEGLHRHMQHDARIFADRIEHHRIAHLGDNFPHDVDGLGLQPFKVGWQYARHRGVPLQKGRYIGGVPAEGNDLSYMIKLLFETRISALCFLRWTRLPHQPATIDSSGFDRPLVAKASRRSASQLQPHAAGFEKRRSAHDPIP